MYGKIKIHCELVVKTGMHIGASSAFSAIGAVDSPVIRDPMTNLPLVPGSSLKGKLRSLLARSFARDIEQLPDFDNDDLRILRLFGSAQPPRRARLQFSDCFVSNREEMDSVGITEVKTENGLNRKNSVANPRQIERVSAGTRFSVNMVYDVVRAQEVEEDMALLAKGMKLLQMDYLGGHGSRGSGRVSLEQFQLSGFETAVDVSALGKLFDEVAAYDLFAL